MNYCLLEVRPNFRWIYFKTLLFSFKLVISKWMDHIKPCWERGSNVLANDVSRNTYAPFYIQGATIPIYLHLLQRPQFFRSKIEKKSIFLKLYPLWSPPLICDLSDSCNVSRVHEHPGTWSPDLITPSKYIIRRIHQWYFPGMLCKGFALSLCAHTVIVRAFE